MDHQILTEEGGIEYDSSDMIWIIDLLEGTNNFVRSYPFYAVSIAIYLGPTVLDGVLKEVHFRDVFFAIKGEGSSCNENQ